MAPGIKAGNATRPSGSVAKVLGWLIGSTSDKNAWSGSSGLSFGGGRGTGYWPGVTTSKITQPAGIRARGFPLGSTSLARAAPQGSSRSVSGLDAAILPEKLTVAPSLCWGSRKKTGISLSGVQAVDLEAAVARDGVILTATKLHARDGAVEA